MNSITFPRTIGYVSDNNPLFQYGVRGQASHKRSSPKQIEYWAEIGKAVARSASTSDLLALMQGFAQVSVTPCPSVAVPPKKVFDALEHDRTQGTLKNVVTKAKVWYEASQHQPGLLDRVHTNGTRETGHFHNGEFIPGP